MLTFVWALGWGDLANEPPPASRPSTVTPLYYNGEQNGVFFQMIFFLLFFCFILGLKVKFLNSMTWKQLLVNCHERNIKKALKSFNVENYRKKIWVCQFIVSIKSNCITVEKVKQFTSKYLDYRYFFKSIYGQDTDQH